MGDATLPHAMGFDYVGEELRVPLRHPHNERRLPQEGGACMEGPAGRGHCSALGNAEDAPRDRVRPRQQGGLGLAIEFKRPSSHVRMELEDPGSLTISFRTWSVCLPRWISSTRTAFGFYLSKLFHLKRDGPRAPPTVLFPLPLVTDQPFGVGNPHQSSRRIRHRDREDRLLTIVVAALNYLYFARGFPPEELVRRQPNTLQEKAIFGLRQLLRTCDPGTSIEVGSAGRRNLQLVTRLTELARVAECNKVANDFYHRTATAAKVDIDNSGSPRLAPFSGLDPQRLKISGKGDWPAAEHMPPELYMPYVEPRVLDLVEPVYERGVPPLEKQSAERSIELFKKWDALGLLALHGVDEVGPAPEGKVRIFNAFKNDLVDRQIGDRRSRNAAEGRIPGPSRELPTGPLLTRVIVPPGHGLSVCVTDRSDFYHQFAVSHERSATNCLWPPVHLSRLSSSKASAEFLERLRSEAAKRRDRLWEGDHFELHPEVGGPTQHDPLVFGSFRAILQGDQLGVEFAIAAHTELLQQGGLLSSPHQLLSSRLVRPSSCYQGLVIDDFFSLSVVGPGWRRSGRQSEAATAFHRAKSLYRDAGLQGSDPKDVYEETRATVIGAEVRSEAGFVKRGLVGVAAPAQKRLALAWICIQQARIAYTSDALHSSLVGSLVSAFGFRRCSMAVLDKLFHVIPPAEVDTSNPRLRPLPRAAADELVLSAALLPVLVSNLASPVLDTIFASDSSQSKGAVVEARCHPDVAQALWQSGDFRGGHVMTEDWTHSFLRRQLAWEPDDFERDRLDSGLPLFPLQGPQAAPSRPLAQHFDFLEVCGGSGRVSTCMSNAGWRVGPVIDLSRSRWYDLLSARLLEWLVWLIQEGRVRAFMVEPPCTSFSPAAYPAVRSYREPLGFSRTNPKTWVGNRLAFFSFVLLKAAEGAGVFGLLENPRRSKMAWLSYWASLKNRDAFDEAFVASCAYGSVHQKEFRFLGVNMRLRSLCRACTRDHEHVRIQGRHAKASAVYVWPLAQALSDLFTRHLEADGRARRRLDVDIDGLESSLTDEVAKRAPWRHSSSWLWKGKSHINVFELSALLHSVKTVARRGGGRGCFLVDSHVALRAAAKGRSSSKALKPLLRKLLAVSVAFGVYASFLYCPTRLNPADDPTRDALLRTPSGSADLGSFSPECLYGLAELPKLRRWASNWVALTLGLSRLWARPAFILPGLSAGGWRSLSRRLPVSLHEVLRDFDSTLGFPGEGPWQSTCLPGCRLALVLGLIVVQLGSCHGMPVSGRLGPRNSGDLERAQLRSGKKLEYGRPVQPATRSSREQLLLAFSDWLEWRGLSLESLLLEAGQRPEVVCDQLIAYGRELFDAGRPFSHYSETINAIGSKKPTVRRLLTAAWDLAFAWLREEPYEHHVACPYPVLLALLTTALSWGWTRVAGLLAISWAGLCRIGEVLGARREDLILPCDVGYTSAFLLLKVQEPKTRFRAARHQVAKIEYADLVELISSVFQALRPGDFLWGASAQTLRNRFKSLLTSLGLPTVSTSERRALDLGSLRPGGATFLLQLTEDSELVRRRGRWLSSRTMEVYLQESAATQFLPSLPAETRNHILLVAATYPSVWAWAAGLLNAGIPESAWWYLLCAQRDVTG